jgi:hypothetical protein
MRIHDRGASQLGSHPTSLARTSSVSSGRPPVPLAEPIFAPGELVTEAGRDAMAYDGVLPETLVILVET